jgi:hypothetical protein
MEKIKKAFWKAPELAVSLMFVGVLVIGLSIYSWIV